MELRINNQLGNRFEILCIASTRAREPRVSCKALLDLADVIERFMLQCSLRVCNREYDVKSEVEIITIVTREENTYRQSMYYGFTSEQVNPNKTIRN